MVLSSTAAYLLLALLHQLLDGLRFDLLRLCSFAWARHDAALVRRAGMLRRHVGGVR